MENPIKFKLYKSIVILFLLVAGYVSIFPAFEGVRKEIKKVDVKGLTLPPAIVKLISAEFRSLAADFLFLRASQFYGGRVKDRQSASKEDWQWLHRNLNLATELDPYFEDPYYLANAILTWDAGMVEEANLLLKKATEKRSWDWWFPFFLGVNKFFLLGENKEGADYLLLASKRPGAWDDLPKLAARLYYRDGRTQKAIAILKVFSDNERNRSVRKSYEIRMESLEKILALEKAAAKYEKIKGRKPKNLEALIQAGIMDKIPEDPYGGLFYIDKDGSIKTTSKLALA